MNYPTTAIKSSRGLSRGRVGNQYNQAAPKSILTATTLIYAIGAGITAISLYNIGD